MIRKWSVYHEGRFLGYVHETTEPLARLAALSAFDEIGTDDFEVELTED